MTIEIFPSCRPGLDENNILSKILRPFSGVQVPSPVDESALAVLVLGLAVLHPLLAPAPLALAVAGRHRPIPRRGLPKIVKEKLM